MKKLLFLFVILLNLWAVPAGLQAQQIHASVAASGGNATGTGGSVSYSVGQTFYTTAFGTNGSVSQGVQQPYEISVVTGIDDIFGIDLNYSVYPNPTKGMLTLKVENYEINDFSYELFDISGRKIKTENLVDKETKIDMGNVNPSTYILRVIKANKEVKSFKIIKN